MAIEIKVEFVIVPFDDTVKHTKSKSELETKINDGWAIDAVHQFDFALVYELRKYLVIQNE